MWYKLPQVVDLRTGFSFLGYANNSVLQQLELNTGSIEVDRSVSCWLRKKTSKRQKGRS